MRLEEAVAAYRAALEERSRERVPLDWAYTQFNMGLALTALGKRTSSRQQLQQALACFQQARSVFQPAGIKRLSDSADAMIARMQEALATGQRRRPVKPSE